MLPIAKCVANAKGNRSDYQLRLNQTDFSVWNESIYTKEAITPVRRV